MIQGSLMQFGLQVMKRHGWILFVCALLGGIASVAYALSTPKKWQATQSLMVRDEMLGQGDKPGRFRTQEEMKSAEETIRTLASNAALVKRALEKLGPPESEPSPQDWPNAEHVDSARNRISIIAPNGAEFGHTELLQVITQESTADRATRLAELITAELIVDLAAVRDLRYAQLESDLRVEVDVANESLREATDALKALEAEIGEDLGELYGLTDPSGNQGPVRLLLLQTQRDLITNQQRLTELQEHLKYLQQLVEDPLQIASTPASLLTEHPELGQIKQGMLSATLSLSDLRAQYSDDHPKVLRTAKTRETLEQELAKQLSRAVRGTEFEIGVVTARVEDLEKTEGKLRRRSDHISELRVPYSETLHRTEQRKSLVTQLEKDLDEIRAARRSLQQSQLVSPLGKAEPSLYPVSTSRSLVVIAGTFAGFVFGIGLIALLVDPRHYTSFAEDAPVSQASVALEIEPTLTLAEDTVVRQPAAEAMTVVDPLPLATAVSEAEEASTPSLDRSVADTPAPVAPEHDATKALLDSLGPSSAATSSTATLVAPKPIQPKQPMPQENLVAPSLEDSLVDFISRPLPEVPRRRNQDHSEDSTGSKPRRTAEPSPLESRLADEIAEMKRDFNAQREAAIREEIARQGQVPRRSS